MQLDNDELEQVLSAESVLARRHAPGFRDAVELMAARALEHEEAQDTATRWLTRDVGRASLYMSAIVLEALIGVVSIQDLIVAAAYNGTCGRGRVMAFIDYAERSGRISLSLGDLHWTRRPLLLRPPFVAFASGRFWPEVEAAAITAPELLQLVGLRENPETFRFAMAYFGRIALARRDLLDDVRQPVYYFLHRDQGMQVLHHLLARQARDRCFLLEKAHLVRSELARSRGISRVHINRILRGAEAAGYLRLPRVDAVDFSPELSESVERHYALMIQVFVAIGRAIAGQLGRPLTTTREAHSTNSVGVSAT